MVVSGLEDRRPPPASAPGWPRSYRTLPIPSFPHTHKTFQTLKDTSMIMASSTSKTALPNTNAAPNSQTPGHPSFRRYVHPSGHRWWRVVSKASSREAQAWRRQKLTLGMGKLQTARLTSMRGTFLSSAILFEGSGTKGAIAFGDPISPNLGTSVE